MRAGAAMGSGNRTAVVLLSGGADSATVLAMAAAEGYAVCAQSFRYGQRHGIEVERAREIARRMKVAHHHIVDIDLAAFGASALTSNLEVPKNRPQAEISAGIPVTYVPARNTIFLSYALAWAEVLGAADIFIGVNALDYSGYPDCRPEYIEAYERMANLATKAAVEGTSKIRIHTPLIAMSKAQIFRAGLALGVDYALTSSCYDPGPNGEPCGACDSCQLRQKGFAELGVADPLLARFSRARSASTSEPGNSLHPAGSSALTLATKLWP
jgi:7-cyano-7-deazaguanine synthase